MNDFFILISNQILSYNIMTLLAFLTLTFLAARYLKVPGIFFGHITIAIIIIVLDLFWVFSEMEKPDWTGEPDLDIIYYLGIIMRVILINVILLPFSIISMRWKVRTS